MSARSPASDEQMSPKPNPKSPKSKGKQALSAVPKATPTQVQDDEARSSSSEDEGEDEVEPVEDEDQMLVDSVATTKRSSYPFLLSKDVFFIFYCQRSGCFNETRRCGYRGRLEGWRTVSWHHYFFSPSHVVKCSLCSSYQGFLVDRSDNEATGEKRYSHFISTSGHPKKCQD